MIYKVNTNHSTYKWILFKYIGPVTVLLQSLVLGTIVGWPAINIPVLLSPESPIQMTTDEVSWMMALLYFGSLLSPIPSGYLMDKYGRKTTLLYFGMLPIITWCLVYFSVNKYQLCFSWFCAGLWWGMVYTVAPVYLGETTIPKHRGFISAICSVIRRTGIMTQFLFSRYLPIKHSALIMLVLPVTMVIAMILMPESPYYHLMNDDRKLARRSLYKIHGKCPKEDKKDIEDELIQLEQFILEEMKSPGRFKDLITVKTNRKTLFIIETIVILLRISETGTIMGYITATLPEKIFYSLEPTQCVMIIEIFRLFTSFLSSLIIDKFNRKTLMITGSIICSVSMTVASAWYYLNTKTNINMTDTNWLPFLCLLIHSTAYCIGLSPVCSSLRSEYFPMNVKGKLAAITSTTFAFVSCVISKIFLLTTDSVGVYLNYGIFAITCFINALFTLLFVIETKGKTLQEIQDELNKCEKNVKSNSTV